MIDQIYGPLIGGILIGLSSTIMLLSLGKITGISGIFATSLLEKFNKENSWRYFFLVGLVGGGFLMKILRPDLFSYQLSDSIPLVILGGFIVGFGTRLGSGCTSGHAISGIADLQLPSLVAVIFFFIGGLIMTYLFLPFILQIPI